MTRWSPSALEAYLLCGVAFLNDRELAHKGYRRATVATALGTAVSAAAKADNDHKITGDGLTLPNLVEVAVAAYETETAEAEIEAAPIEISQGKDSTAGAAICYGREVSEQIQDVVVAEHKFCAQVTGSIELCGQPDVITTTSVRDTKTGQPWDQDRADRSRQLTGYDLLHEAAYETKPARMAIDSIHETRTGWKATTLWTTRGPDDRARFLRTVEAVDGAVRAGVFLPPSEKSWKCSAKWCGHWNVCPLRPGG